MSNAWIVVLLVAVLLLMAGASAIEDADPAAPPVAPVPSPPHRTETHPMTIYRYLDFASGDGSDWDAEVTQGGGIITYVTSDPAPYTGAYCMRNWTPATATTRRAKCALIDVPNTLTELYYGGATYIPSGFGMTVQDWCQICSLPDPRRGFEPNPAKGDRYADLSFQYFPATVGLVLDFTTRVGGYRLIHRIDIDDVVFGGWNTWCIYWKRGNPAGVVALWWNNDDEASPTCMDVGDYDLETDAAGCQCHAGLYRGDQSPNALWVAHDALTVASTFAEAYPTHIAPEPPEPPIPPTPAESYTVQLLASTGGYTVPTPGIYTPFVGDAFTATAYHFADYAFTRWLLNDVSYTASPAIVVTGPAALQPVFTALPGEPASPEPEPPTPTEPEPEVTPPEAPEIPPPETPQLPDAALPLDDSQFFNRVLLALQRTTPTAFTDIVTQLQRTQPPNFNDIIRWLQRAKVNA